MKHSHAQHEASTPEDDKLMRLSVEMTHRDPLLLWNPQLHVTNMDAKPEHEEHWFHILRDTKRRPVQV